MKRRETNKITMPPGEYWVGDLCYVLGDVWDDVCSLIIQGRDVVDGVFTLPDGRRFANFGTAYGDGYYPDQYGNHYAVDSGTIGCVLAADVEAHDLGHLHKFDKRILVRYEDGVIKIGHVFINTNDEDMKQWLADMAAASPSK